MKNTRKLPSRITVEGLDRAPHRAFLRALGLSADDLAKPFVGVASTDGRVTPCNALLGEFAREACAAVREAGGVPFDFASISVADSMSMNHGGMRYSLVSREIIADGVEAVVRGHAYDALVTFAGCDKTLPGMMMAMVRLDLPSVFVYGGAALPGRWHGRDVTVLDTYEGVGAVLAGNMKESELDELEQACIPDARLVPGPVHRQHDGDGRRDARPRAAGLRHAARRRRDQNAPRTRGRHDGDAAARRTADRCRASS